LPLVSLGAAGLLALAAVGALRSPPGSGSGRPRFPTALVESLLLAAMMAVLLATVAALYALGPGPRRARRVARRSAWASLALPLLLTAVFWLLHRAPHRWRWLHLPAAPTVASSQVPATPDSAGGATQAQPEWLPVLLLGGLLLTATAGLLYGAWRRRRRRQPPRPRELAALVDAALGDAEGETDPRRAVIAAWAGMERRFAAAGLARRPAETPLEYVARILAQAVPVGLAAAPVRVLADLFEQAKFSHHEISQAMRARALAALRAVRDDLDAAAASPDGEATEAAAEQEREAPWPAR
jgi:hypothetical protein